MWMSWGDQQIWPLSNKYYWTSRPDASDQGGSKKHNHCNICPSRWTICCQQDSPAVYTRGCPIITIKRCCLDFVRSGQWIELDGYNHEDHWMSRIHQCQHCVYRHKPSPFDTVHADYLDLSPCWVIFERWDGQGIPNQVIPPLADNLVAKDGITSAQSWLRKQSNKALLTTFMNDCDPLDSGGDPVLAMLRCNRSWKAGLLLPYGWWCHHAVVGKDMTVTVAGIVSAIENTGVW